MRLLLVAALLAAVALGAEQHALRGESAELAVETQLEQEQEMTEAEKPKKHHKKHHHHHHHDEDDKLKVRPLIVDKLQSEEQVPVKEEKSTTASVEGVDHNENIGVIEKNLKEAQQTIQDLGEKLERTYQNKIRLQLLKDMTSAVASLNKAQSYLKKIDHKIAKYKKKVHHFAERAKDIVENMKRSEEEHKKELAHSNKILGQIHKGLTEAEIDMKKLAARRHTVHGVAKKWAQLVKVLKQAKENYALTHDANGHLKPNAPVKEVKKPGSGLFEEDFALPTPPNPNDILAGLGLAPKALNPAVNHASPAASALRGVNPANHAVAHAVAPGYAPSSQKDVAAAAHRFSGVDMERETQELEAELGSEMNAEDEAMEQEMDAADAE